MIFQIPHCPSVPGAWNVGLGAWHLKRGILSIFPLRTGRRFRYADAPCADQPYQRSRRDDTSIVRQKFVHVFLLPAIRSVVIPGEDPESRVSKRTLDSGSSRE